MSASEELFGFLNVDKPSGWTSRQVVNHVQRLVRPAKIGHAGTLDPIAEGVLILCIGKATRLVPRLHDMPKTYLGEFLLGITSESADTESDVQPLDDPPVITRDQLLSVLPDFLGKITQIPPIFSAVKVGGRRAYKLARQGKSPDVKPREVEIERLTLRELDPPRFVLEMTCSSGTYVRALGRDLARSLGSDAVMSGLNRTQIGPFGKETAVSPEMITGATLRDLLIPATAAVSELPSFVCEDANRERLRNGHAIRDADAARYHSGDECAVLSSAGRLIAIGEIRNDTSEIVPRQVFP